MNENDSAVRMFVEKLKVMIFIDGGYVRQTLNDIQAKKKGDELDLRKGKEEGDRVDYSHISNRLLSVFSIESIHLDLVRTYFYDGIPDVKLEKEYEQQHQYLERIRGLDYFEVRGGRVIKDDNGKMTQKGLDVLFTIDMLSHAYENNYDIAIVVSGDDDFLDIVKSVKNRGKRVFGAYFSRSISENLKSIFDRRYELGLKDFE